MAYSSEPGARRGFVPARDADEQLLQRRVEELCRRAEYTGRAQYTDFLTDRQQELALAAVNRAGGAAVRMLGGYENAERSVLCILPWEDAEAETPVKCAKLEPNDKSAKLQHRDCLGAVLGLGIERKSLGDIVLCADGGALVFCRESALQLMLRELCEVGREAVRCREARPEEAAESAAGQGETHTASVASLRLDAVLAAMLHCGREEAVKLIRAGRVEINHMETGNPHAAVYERDIFTVRGKGRFRLEAIGGRSRKDRIFVEYFQY